MLSRQTQTKKQKIVILGSTGSIGLSSLSVLELHLANFEIYGLVAGSQYQLIFEQILKYRPKYAALHDKHSAIELEKLLVQYFQDHPDEKYPIQILAGQDDICSLASDDSVDQVIAAIVGGAGLLPTLSAVYAGKRVLLANKESLVMCGKLFMQEAKRHNAQILPLDSEHNAIFQALPVEIQSSLGQVSLADFGVKSLILTGSGGPFLHKPVNQFSDITVEDAIAHPRWTMGAKISVDSATMMNKGLEYIEACHLFNAQKEEVEVVLHPQSVIHSMVRYKDGSVIAQMGNTSMTIPIAYALSYPERMNSPAEHLDFYKLGELTFSEPEQVKYPCLYLAKDAFNLGQAATTTLNAANEIAVQAFLSRTICFTDIAKINSEMLSRLQFAEPKNIDEVLEIDKQSRSESLLFIKKELLS